MKTTSQLFAKVGMISLFLLLFIPLAFATSPSPPQDRVPEKTLSYTLIRNVIVNSTLGNYYDVIFHEGDTFNVGIQIRNPNNLNIPFSINNITLHDHFKLRPGDDPWHMQERINASQVAFCTMRYPIAEQIVRANNQTIINVTISCESASCIKKYPSEDACWLTLIPEITYRVDGEDKEMEVLSFD
ncbi:hypothetical protein HZB02_05540 [Candidatus Woesearchaeota archaeon]|nr:hypothetical protein [Candidatus Woesearchaeota archaeon]